MSDRPTVNTSIELKTVTPNMATTVPSDGKNEEKPEVKTEVGENNPVIDTKDERGNDNPKSEDVPKPEKEVPKRNEGDGGNESDVNEPTNKTDVSFNVLGFGTEREIPDLNFYQHKKTLGKGMMDLALFSANANQLRYVLECQDRHPYFYPSMILIVFSLICQVAVGLALLWNAMYNIKLDMNRANRANNCTVIGIFLVTVINVFISAFGVANAPPVVAVAVATTAGQV